MAKDLTIYINVNDRYKLDTFYEKYEKYWLGQGCDLVTKSKYNYDISYINISLTVLKEMIVSLKNIDNVDLKYKIRDAFDGEYNENRICRFIMDVKNYIIGLYLTYF